MKSETPTEKYRREAAECQLNAANAERTIDRKAWLRLAADWTKLAEAADFNPLLSEGSRFKLAAQPSTYARRSRRK